MEDESKEKTGTETEQSPEKTDAADSAGQNGNKQSVYQFGPPPMSSRERLARIELIVVGIIIFGLLLLKPVSSAMINVWTRFNAPIKAVRICEEYGISDAKAEFGKTVDVGDYHKLLILSISGNGFKNLSSDERMSLIGELETIDFNYLLSPKKQYSIFREYRFDETPADEYYYVNSDNYYINSDVTTRRTTKRAAVKTTTTVKQSTYRSLSHTYPDYKPPTYYYVPKTSAHKGDYDNIRDYGYAEDFYEDYYDDFDSFEDAEDYFDSNY